MMRVRWAVALTMTLLLAGGASAAVDPALAQLVKDLGSADYQVRQQATHRLLANEALTPAVVEELAALASSPEQRHRLLDVGRHHVIRQMVATNFGDDVRGAVGVSQAALTAQQLADIGQPAILVIRTFPGFPAYSHLRSGDLIIKFNGQGLPSNLRVEQVSEAFVAMVSNNPAGTPVILTVIRDGQQVDTRFRLASARALGTMYNTATTRLHPHFNKPWQDFYDKLTAGKAAALQVPAESDGSPAAPRN